MPQGDLTTVIEHQVRAHLTPFVRSIVGYAEADHDAMMAHQVPTTVIPLILVTGPGFQRFDPANGSQDLASSFVAGVHQHTVTIASDGGAKCIQVDIYPAAAQRLLAIDMTDASNSIVDLEDIARRRFARLNDKLLRARSWPDRFAIVDRELTLALAGHRDDLADWAMQRILVTSGAVRIDELARDAGCTRKHLNNVFRRRVGVSPKSFCRIARFERAHDLTTSTDTALADIAFETGYADQAHMAREFRDLSGAAPSGWREVTNLQASGTREGGGSADRL